jgi:hypothetical protein
MKTLIVLLTLVSIMGHTLDRSGNIRMSLRDGTAYRSGVAVKGSNAFLWYRAHVSRDSVATFGDTDAETVTVEFSGDTIQTIK